VTCPKLLPSDMPMRLARFDIPFKHPEWISSPKLDGFRAVPYVEAGACRLVSRNRNAFRTLEPVAQASGEQLARPRRHPRRRDRGFRAGRLCHVLRS
jgi:ATP-dependent DNA ligase